MIELEIATSDDMEAFGALLADHLEAGDLVLLNGELGAGKTTLTRGLGERLGVRGAVTSPTFVLARTHPRPGGGAPLVHVDAYRLPSALELDDLDLDFENAIVVVEWGAGKLDGVSESWLEIDIDRHSVPELVDEPTLHGGVSTSSMTEYDPRSVRVTGHGPRWNDLGWIGAPRD